MGIRLAWALAPVDVPGVVARPPAGVVVGSGETFGAELFAEYEEVDAAVDCNGAFGVPRGHSVGVGVEQVVAAEVVDRFSGKPDQAKVPRPQLGIAGSGLRRR